MKETKVYVDELPVNCDKCKYYTQFDNGMGCMIIQELRPMDKQDNYTQLDCPLVDIKTHDRELVKEVCEKIKEQLGFIVDGQERIVCDGSATGDKTILAVLNQLQKEYEK